MAASRFVAWYRRYYLLVNLPALLVATELVLSRLDPVNWSRSSNLDHAMARYQSSPPGDSPVLLVLGNSVVRSGVDQSVVEARLHGPASWRVYNFGLNTATLEDEIELLEYLQHRGIKPRAVVLGVNLYSIRDADSDSRYPWHHRRSPYVFFHRNYLFNAVKARLPQLIDPTREDPRTAGNAVGVPTPRDPASPIDPTREDPRTAGNAVGVPTPRDPASPIDPTREDPRTAVPKQPTRSSQFSNAILTPEQLDTQVRTFIGAFAHHRGDDFPMLDELPVVLQWIAAHGIRAYVVVLPMNPLVSELDTYPALVAAIRDRIPRGSLDLTGAGYAKDLFDDVGHLNERGRRLLTAQLVEWLDSTGELRSP